MKKEKYIEDLCFEDFVVELYKYIKDAAKRETGIEVQIDVNNCKKWSNENIENIECS